MLGPFPIHQSTRCTSPPGTFRPAGKAMCCFRVLERGPAVESEAGDSHNRELDGRAFGAMMETMKIDIAAIEAARRG